MFSSAPTRLLSALLVFGIGLRLSGLRMLLPQVLRPKPLPFGHNGTEAAAARRTRAVLAAEIGVIRGDFWAEAAFTGARFMGTDRSTSLDRGQFRTIRAGQSQRGDGLRARPGRWRGMAFFGEDSGKFAERREPRGSLLERSYCTAPSALDLAPWRLERGNLKRARGLGPPGVHQERYSRDSGSRARISTSEHGRPSQRLAAEPAYFRISCGRCQSGRGPIASLRPAKMRAVGQLRRLPGKPLLNSLVLQVRGSTFKLAPRAESRRPVPRAKAKRNRSVPPNFAIAKGSNDEEDQG
jgi:hypothetical protein